jgi:hypothetical protein
MFYLQNQFLFYFLQIRHNLFAIWTHGIWRTAVVEVLAFAECLGIDADGIVRVPLRVLGS